MLNGTPRIHMMIGKLYDLYQHGHISGEWNERFVRDMHSRLVNGCSFSERQVVKIEELFERN